jgi:AcrR family transcriptional regulator
MADDVADARRDQMVVAAAALIAERGFSETRIVDVARRVGASPGLVIYYFGTKDTLLTEALRWSERAFHEEVEEMLRVHRSIVRRIELLVAWVLRSDGPDGAPADWGLWFDLWTQAFRHPGVKQDRAQLDQQWRDLIGRIVADGIAAGEIARPDVRAFTVMWSALLDGLAVQVALGDPVVDARLAQRIALDVAHRELGLPTRPRRVRAAATRR